MSHSHRYYELCCMYEDVYQAVKAGEMESSELHRLERQMIRESRNARTSLNQAIANEAFERRSRSWR